MNTTHDKLAAGGAAARLTQQKREEEALANHRDRLVWLKGERPLWSCGTPVDSYTRRVLLLQSECAIATSSPTPSTKARTEALKGL